MIYELRACTLLPGKRAGTSSSRAFSRRFAATTTKLEGFWSTEFGTLNQVVHLWTFESLNERERLRGELAKNEEWTKGYLPQTRGMLLAQENKILSSVLPLKPPADPGHVYELRWYRAHVGRLAEWIGLFKGVMPTREKYSKNVGVFQTEAGQLNEAVHLWAYKDLNDRVAVRARCFRTPSGRSSSASPPRASPR
jgi:hypothetical protein